MGKGLPEARPQLTCDPKVVFISFRHSFAHPPRATCILGLKITVNFMGSVLLPPENKTNALHRVWEVSSVSHGHTSLLPGDTAGLPPLPQEPPQGAKAPSPPSPWGCLALRCPASLQVPLTRIRTGRAGAGAFTAPTGAQRAEHCLLNGQGAFGNLHDAALKTSVCRTCQGHTLQPWKWL